MRRNATFDARGVLDAVAEAIVPRLDRVGVIIETVAKESMKDGGRSIGPKGGKVFTPSAPGTPPNVQSGDLRKSIRHSINEKQTGVVVGPTLDAWYGRIHEFGGTKHPARPFMRPAVYGAISRIPQEFKGLNLANTSAGRKLNSKRGLQ